MHMTMCSILISKTTHRSISHNSSWLSPKTRTQSNGKGKPRKSGKTYIQQQSRWKSTSDVVNDKQFFLTGEENENESEVETLQRKEQSRQDAKQWVAKMELLRTIVKRSTKIEENSTSYCMHVIEATTL